MTLCTFYLNIYYIFLGATTKEDTPLVQQDKSAESILDCLGDMSTYGAAKVYSVPPTTLRDIISGPVASDARLGHETIFTSGEEGKLYKHTTYMTVIGFGYNKTAIQYMAKDSLGKSN